MSKTPRYFMYSILFVIVLLIICRLTWVYCFWTVPNPANEPGLKKGSYHLSSNLIQPKINDFVCFEHIENDEKTPYVFRLVAISGNKVEIKNSILFINDINVDESMNLKRNYKVSAEDYLKHKALINDWILLEQERNIERTDSIIVPLEDAWLNSIINGRRIISNEPNPFTMEFYGEQWSPSNFGPYVVPKDHFFVMGDNRDNALDSRFFGPIPKSKFMGTILTAN